MHQTRPALKLAALIALALSLPALGQPPAGPEERKRPWRLEGSTARLRPTPAMRRERAARLPAGQLTMPHLNYYGGKVLANVKLVGVYWEYGGYFASAEGQDFIAQTDAFYTAFATSADFDWLSEYSTVGLSGGSNQTIGRGSYLRGVVIHPNNTSGQFGEPEIIRELTTQITSGNLPANDANTLYELHFARGINLVDGNTAACSGYCAYHDSFGRDGQRVFFSVIPDHSPPSLCRFCGESSDWYANMTASAAHEVTEATTDADVGGAGINDCGPAWCDPAGADYFGEHAEIGDICEDDFTPSNGGSSSEVLTEGTFSAGGKQWTVQREWSNHYNACVVGRKDAFSLSVSPDSRAVHGAGVYDFDITTTQPTAGATQVTLGYFKLPAGVSISFTPPTILAGGSAKMHVNVGNGIDGASTDLGVFGNSGNTLAYGLAKLTTDDFNVSGTPTSLTLKAGSSTNLTVNTTLSPGSAPQTINVQLTGKPPGVSMTPQTIQAGQSANLQIDAAAGSPTLSQGALTLTLTNGLRLKTLVVPIVLDGDDFTATTDAAAPVLVPIGGTAKFRIATQTVHGNPQTLTPTAKQLPPGVTAVFSPTTVQSGGTLTVALQASGNSPPGAGSLVVTVAGLANSTDLQMTTLLQSQGCSTGGGGAAGLAALALIALVYRRRRNPAM